MLTYFDFGPEKNQSHKKKVDRNGNGGMLPDLLPGFFHIGAPVDVVKNKNAVFCFIGQQLIKIRNGGCIAVVAVNVGKVNLRNA